jgi:riboflavin synthase
MFAGIVSAIGRIGSATPRGDGIRLRIEAPGFGLGEVKIGDSIAIQGACHTVVALHADAFDVDTSRATLAVTAGLEQGRVVNLERSLRMGDRVDGHLVSGHVDGVGRVLACDDLGASARLEIEAPEALARCIALKGSIAVDGVSLTVNAVRGAAFEVNVIPHTRSVTTLGHLVPGSRVNLEIDMIARYVERALGMGEGNRAK